MSLLVDSVKRVLAPHMENLVTKTGLSSRQILYVSAGALTSAYLITKYVRNRRHKSKYKLPPGPRPWPIFGNAIELSFSKLDAPNNFLHMAQTKYGPVILLNILGMEFVVLNSLEVIQEAMGEKQDDFANRPHTWSAEVFSNGGQSIGWGQYGPKWRFQRLIVHQAVRKVASGKMLEHVVRKAFDQVAAEIQKVDGAIAMKKMISLLSFDATATLCFGKEYHLDDPEFKHLMKMVADATEIFGSGTPVDFMPSLAYFPLCWPKMKALKDIIRDYFALIQGEVDEHRADYSSGNELRDLTDCFFEQQAKAEMEDSSKANLLTDNDIAMTVLDVFGAGIDTINQSVSWFLIHMAKYPQVQERVRKEIEDKWTANVELVHLHSQLTYTHAVLHEVLRLETLANIGMPVVTARDTSVGGYDLPKGTIVINNFWAMHHNPEYWEKPDEFRPERFLEEDGKLKRHASFMPFGVGHRRCVGELMARNELMMIITLLINKFEWSRPPGMEEFYTKMPISLGSAIKEFHLVASARN